WPATVSRWILTKSVERSSVRASADGRGRHALMVGLALAVGVAGCAPRMASVALPAGTGTPLESAAVQAAAAAMAAPCLGLQALTADLRIAGRVDGEKVRGTLQVGVDAGAIRIE